MNNFDFDIFISYAHIDNAALSEQEGWIDALHQALTIRLAQMLGEQPKIWRDRKLQGNDRFDQTIVNRLLKAAVLVSVLSPCYVKSEWCTKELHTFYEAAKKNGSPREAEKTRIFKVIKTPVPVEKHPLEVQPLLGYKFFEVDPLTDRPREFNRIFGLEAERRYWSRLEDLAYDIHQLLDAIKARGDGAPPRPASGITVYLAETTFDLNEEHDQIRRELQQHGHTVLPDGTLPLRGPDLESMVQDDLERCTLSIHLVGEHYGIVPEVADRSVIEAQNALAAERSLDAAFTRLIWLPRDVQIEREDQPGYVTEARQRAFIQKLKDDPDVQRGADLLQTTLDELKTVIHDKLKPREAAPVTAPPTEDAPPLIYLLCDARDDEAVQPLDDYLFEQAKMEVRRPLFEGDEAEIREDHQENLRLCDAVLIYYGHAGEAWLRAKLRDLRKAPGYGRKRAFAATAVYVAGPEDRRKERFRSHEVDAVIKHYDAFSPDVVAPFLDRINAQRGGPGR